MLRFSSLILGLMLILPLGVPTPVSAQDATPASASPIAAGGDFAGLVEIDGGRRMYLECHGQGSPTVVLVSGWPNTGAFWRIDVPEVPQPQVMPAVARFTRVCTYDRPGTRGISPQDRSRSDPVPQPFAGEDAVADLHALLRAAQVPGPYVLTGHSLGGLLVRLYASTYPDEVAGLVLVDATNEQFRKTLTPAQWALLTANFNVSEAELASYPELEQVDLDALYDAMSRAAAAQPLRPLPLVVLSRGREDELPPEFLEGQPPSFPDDLAAAWSVGQAFLAALLPDARQVIATEAGHYIQVEQPQLVTDAIWQVVTAVRDPTSWTPDAKGAGVAGRASGGIIYDLRGGERFLAVSATLHSDTCTQKEE